MPLTISNIQSARIVDKGNVEFTPSVSTTTNTFNLGDIGAIPTASAALFLFYIILKYMTQIIFCK